MTHSRIHEDKREREREKTMEGATEGKNPIESGEKCWYRHTERVHREAPIHSTGEPTGSRTACCRRP